MMKIVLIKYGLSSETVNAIMILYKITRSMVRSPDGDTPFFEITIGVRNWSKNKFRKDMSFNQNEKTKSIIKSLNGENIKKVDDFKYLGSYIGSTEHDINIRIAKAWAALNNLNIIWKSNLRENLKINFFRAAVETVLVYGSITWKMTVAMERKIDGTYTRMLRAITNKHWNPHLTNEELYKNIPKISDTIRKQRLHFAGHCWRSKDELASDLLLWNPKHGKRSRGRPRKSYIDQLKEDTMLKIEQLPTAMNDRNEWKLRVMKCRASSTW